MSYAHVRFVLDQVEGLTSTEKLVLVALAEYADEKGRCWPSHDSLGKRAGVSRRQVMRVLHGLTERGLIGQETRKQYSNVYVVRCDIAAADVTSGVQPYSDVTLGTPDVTSMTADVTSGVSRCDTAMSHKPPITTKLEPPVEPSGGARAKKATQLPDDFAVSDDLYGWAWSEVEMQRAEVDRETEKFRDYHRAKGSTMKDWVAAWRNWMRNSVRFNGRASNGRASPGKPSNADISAANIDAAFGEDRFGVTGPVLETTGRIRQ